MHVKLICISIILLFGLSSSAQLKIHGNVKDSSGKYVAYATVIILNADQGTTLYFSMVDKNGAYAIEIPAEHKNLEALTIQVTSVGHQKTTKRFLEGVTEYNFYIAGRS